MITERSCFFRGKVVQPEDFQGCIMCAYLRQQQEEHARRSRKIMESWPDWKKDAIAQIAGHKDWTSWRNHGV